MRTISSRTETNSGWAAGGRYGVRSAVGSAARAASNASMYRSRSIHWTLGRRLGGRLLMVVQKGGELLAAVLERSFDGPEAAAGQAGDLVDLVALHAQLHDAALQGGQLGQGLLGRQPHERHARLAVRVFLRQRVRVQPVDPPGAADVALRRAV